MEFYGSHIGSVRWMFQSLPLLAAQEVCDSSSSGVTPCTVMKNDGSLYYQVSSFSRKSMRLRSLRQSEWTKRLLVQHKRWTYPCSRAVNTEYQQRWTCWWQTTPSKHLAKGHKSGERLYWRYINDVPLWIKPCQKCQAVAITFYPTPVNNLDVEYTTITNFGMCNASRRNAQFYPTNSWPVSGM